MTTFIDFRYSAAQASALQHGFVDGNNDLEFNSDDDGYLLLELIEESPVGCLATIGDLILLCDSNQNIIFQTSSISVCHPTSLNLTKDRILALRFGPTAIGIKYGEKVEEQPAKLEAGSCPRKISLSPNVRIMGQESGRARIWSKIYYQRKVPQGITIELVMDWQNLQSGIPGSGIATAEQLLIHSNFKLLFKSYACNEAQANNSDFSRLFSSRSSPQLTLHITPPIYTQANPNTVNIGIFVVESKKVAISIINRCNQMDALIVPTKFVERVLRDNGVKCPIYVLQYGVDLDFFKPVKSKTALNSGKGFNILAVAAYSERKNIYHLARAFMEEFRLTEDIALHLYIRPEYLLTQHNLLQMFTEWENWHFNESGLILISTSYTSRERLRDLYANADLYLMPSNEGFGFTILEAMACGTPAIGLGYGGQTDFLNSENGYVVPAGKSYVCKNMDLLPYVGDLFYAPNITQLRRTLRHTFEHREELARRGQVARQTIESKYSWNEFGKSIVTLIAKIFDQSQQSRSPKVSISNNKNSALTWMLGVIDDSNAKNLIPSLKSEQQKGRDIICLFTRYGNHKDAIKARNNGFLLYRWDTTPENFKTLALQLVKTPWVGLLYPEDKLNGNVDGLIQFLESQPAEVTEVKVRAAGNQVDARFFRISAEKGNGSAVEYSHFQFS